MLSHMHSPATLANAIFVGLDVMTNVGFQVLIMKPAGKFNGKSGLRACYPYVAERIWVNIFGLFEAVGLEG